MATTNHPHDVARREVDAVRLGKIGEFEKEIEVVPAEGPMLPDVPEEEPATAPQKEPVPA